MNNFLTKFRNFVRDKQAKLFQSSFHMSNVSGCEVAAAVASDSRVVISHLLILIFDFLSFIILGTFIWVLIRIQSIHPNVRAINLTIAFGYLIRNVYTTYRSGVKIFLVIFVSYYFAFYCILVRAGLHLLGGVAFTKFVSLPYLSIF